ncbi:hypothetical protein [Streptomyces antarcticus]|uniref:hypothetical protein n=1 Tax=Streptomyces antarcticus TaxID=2996458 RepID=UPI002271D95A|nr:MULTISPECIES: hypothetical protein [unclassified Streptomyces]MCY0947197.1 hypothetical protein [Streptomyces sp. H34-AA3]MCZ4087905.1 hypothetical protein [Streptomyces sp. H34-S5]
MTGWAFAQRLPDRSPNDSFRALQALTLHRPEQYMAFDRRSNPAIHRVPQTVHSATPAPSCTAASRFRSLC